MEKLKGTVDYITSWSCLVQFQKISLPTPRKVTGNSKNGGGVSKPQFLRKVYLAKLEIQTKNFFVGEGMGIFWNHTWLSLVCWQIDQSVIIISMTFANSLQSINGHLFLIACYLITCFGRLHCPSIYRFDRSHCLMFARLCHRNNWFADCLSMIRKYKTLIV